MLTTQSIFEELQSETESFPTYKELLESVGKMWQKHVGELPVEIGPRDLVELAVLRQWIQQDKNGAIKIVIPRGVDRTPTSPVGIRRPATSQGLALEGDRTMRTNAVARAISRGASVQRLARPLNSSIAKSRVNSSQ